MASSEYIKLEQRLVLVDWVCHKLGYESNKADAPKSARSGRRLRPARAVPFLVQPIAARGSKCKIAAEDLERYDANIGRT